MDNHSEGNMVRGDTMDNQIGEYGPTPTPR